MVLCAPAARLKLSGMLKSHHQKGNSAPWRSQHSCRTRSRRGWPQGVRWRWETAATESDIVISVSSSSSSSSSYSSSYSSSSSSSYSSTATRTTSSSSSNNSNSSGGGGSSSNGGGGGKFSSSLVRHRSLRSSSRALMFAQLPFRTSCMLQTI